MKQSNYEKPTTYRFFVLNIKIISDKPVKAQSYKDLFVNSFKNKTMGRIRGERFGIIRQLFSKQNTLYIYGTFCSFVKIEGLALDLESMDIVEYEIPKNILPNAKETRFVFYPELHRLAIYAGGEVSIYAIINMLRDMLMKTIGEENRIDIVIEQSVDGFNRILDAAEIRSLYIEVSPSNGDLNKDYVKFVDNDLKNGNLDQLKMEMRPRGKSSLNYEGSQILQGVMGMARSNGFAKAQIITKDNKHEKIETTEYPRNFSVICVKEEDAMLEMYNELKSEYKDDKK